VKKSSRTALVAAFAAAVVVLSADAFAGGTRPSFQAHIDAVSAPLGHVPGEVMVTFRAGAPRLAVARAHARVGARVAMRMRAFDMEVVRLPSGLSVRAAVQRYERDPAVRFAEPNYVRYPSVIPSDPVFPDLWGLENTGQTHSVSEGGSDAAGTAGADLDAPTAWDDEQGSGTVVAVIDSGVDIDHADLAGQIWTNPDEIDDNLDNDGNGKLDDLHGWDFADGEGDTLLDTPPHFDLYEHGTHVAGTIAAELGGTSPTGVVGICPGCEIMVLKIAENDGSMPISNEVAALNYATMEGARIANLSLGGPLFSNSEREAIRKSGMLVVAAAGNESLDNDMALASDLDGDGGIDIASPSYPAAYSLSNILTVAASNHHDEYGYQTECHLDLGFSKAVCAFTNWGHDSVDVAAPGVDITSTVPGGDWETWDGTSMAAPHVSGIAGLVWGQNPLFSVAQVKNAIMRSVDTQASLTTMYIAPAPGLTGAKTKSGSFTRTSGRVNADKALDQLTPTNATPITDGNVDGAKSMSTSKVSGSVSWPADVNDVRRIKLRRGRTYRFTLVVPRRADYDLIVWKPGAKEIWQFSKLRTYSARVGSADEVVKFKAKATGTYYVQVSAWLYKSGKYTLKFAKL
jgi:subtilisin family serine protease